MKVVYIQSPIYDYLTATLIEGLQELGHEVMCSEDGNYGRKVPDGVLLEAAESADIVILGSNHGVRSDLLRNVRNPRKVFVDGSDSAAINPPSGFDFKLIFKRELLKTDRNASTRAIFPLPFAGEKRYVPAGPPPLRDIKVCFLANLFTNPLRYSVHQRLRNLDDPLILSGTTGERAYDSAQPRATPLETPRYRQLLRRSRIAVNVAGLGWDCGRYWEILSAGAMLFTQELDIVIPEELRDGIECATFRDLPEFDKKLAYYLENPQRASEVAARGHEHFLKHHTTRARAQYFVGLADQHVREWGRKGWHAAVPTNAGPAPELGISAALADPAQVSIPAPGASSADEARLPSPAAESAAPSYYGYARPEVRDLVPLSARRVLDIGCGLGALGVAIKRRQECHVTGIEMQADVAAKARGVLDDVHCGDAFTMLRALPPASFDAIIMADVLEHVDDSDGLLTLARERLADGGRLVLSIPNVRHWSVVIPLLAGRWEYKEAGILDRTHLRFFTRRSMLELIARNHLQVEHVAATVQPLDVPRAMFSAFEAARIDVEELMEDLQRYQYLFVCTPRL